MLRALRNRCSLSAALIPIQAVASPSHLRRLSTLSPLSRAFVRQPISPSRSHIPSLNPNRISSFSGSKPTAWFSSGGGLVSAGREVLVQHLLVKDDDVELLSQLQKRIADGEEMGKLAMEYSICPSKQEEGMLGWVTAGQMVPEFEEAAFGAPLNQVVKCKTEFGWHLLQVLRDREVFIEEIQVEELHAKMKDPSFMEGAQLIDVREPDEISKSSLPGFKVFPLRQLDNWGPEITRKLDPQKDTYVMCHHGRRSLKVSKFLHSQGFKRVVNIAGGIHAYSLRADPSVPTY